MHRIGLDMRNWRAESGGVGRYNRNLLKELLAIDSENHYTAIITPKGEKEFNVKAPNLEKLVVEYDNYSSDEQRYLPALLKQQQFDLVHFTQFNHPIFYRQPFVITIHDIIMHLYPSGRQKDSWLRRLAYRRVFNDCQRAERIIVPSQSTKDDLVEKLGFPLEKINVTAEGSEAAFRLHTPAEKQKIIQKYALPKRFILFVSRWEEYKGLPALIKAFEVLSKKYPDLGLVIAGEPSKQNPSVAELVKTAQSTNKNIVTPGFIADADLAPLYAAATVYVHPSWYEGFGIMILEAFASGVPVVTSNVSSLPEVAGEAALLVDPKNPKAIAENIEKILADSTLAESLKQKG
ncbi:MAG: glycosyltransferase family 1 protein, partial [Patescibacteria group bacterium]